MPVNDQRVIQIIFENINKIEEKYVGYTDDLKHLIGEVMMLERDHQIQKTNIKQLMGEKIGIAANDLYEKTK